jgi:hypothetical protein
VSQPYERITAEGLHPFASCRGDTDPPDERQVETCRRWLRLFAEPRKTINLRYDSYGHKHRVEHWTRAYISNGALVEAARREGYRIVRTHASSPNARFNFGVRQHPRLALVPSEGRAPT